LAQLVGTALDIAALRRRLRELQPDFVHTNSLKAAVYGGLAARLARVPVVWHIRDRIAPDYLPKSAVLALRSLAFLVPDAVIFNSRSTRATMGHLRRVSVIPSPVIHDSAAPHEHRAAERDGALTVAMVGRLAPWKGQHIFLDAFAKAFPNDNSRAIIAGSAMFGEDNYEQELRRLADRLCLSDRVEFAGFVDDVSALLRNVDVIVHASVIPEPFGQVVVEGMAAGLAVIASDAGGPSEVITDEVNGILVPLGDSEALAAQLSRLAGDASLRTRLGAVARERARDFDPKRIAAQVRAVWTAVGEHKP
jgi:glycosyltransferase involved in cell wall biosynthesis